MNTDKGTLIFFCGKMGAGKSTKSKEVALQRNAVLLSEDEWLATLYPNQISSFKDYLKFSAQLRPLVRSHVQNILSTGTNVVMDFPANTIRQRLWFKELALEIDSYYELIYLKISEEICLQRIAQRRIEQPERAAFDTEEVFNQVTKFFEEPSDSEDLIASQVTKNA
ncbi:MAG TPA: ATP-binding protein [Bacteroidetes bacterium]|nr:ATP-binding protein [Bacteroidota bacterium]